MKQEFYSNGKLLLSGEYAVLDGALAWAIPTTFGQYLRISINTSAEISWKSLDENGKVLDNSKSKHRFSQLNTPRFP